MSHLGPLAARLVIAAAFAAAIPGFGTCRNAQTLLSQASIPLVLAMGSTLVILMGSIDLSIEGVMAACGLTFVLLTSNSVNSNDIGAWAIAVSLGGGLAFGLAAGAINLFLKIPSFIATFGVWYIGLGIATVLYGTAMPAMRNPRLVAWPSAAPLLLNNETWVALSVVLLTSLFLKFTTIGRNIIAIGGDEELAKVNSVPIRQTKMAAFALAGVLSAIGGILATMRVGNGITNVGSGQLFFTTAAVVVGGTLLTGGRGGVANSVVGVALLTVIDNGLVLSGASPIIQQVICGLVIIGAVILSGLPSVERLRVIK